MAKETILIGCRLPNGIVLQHPKNPNVTVELAGTYGKKTEAGIYLPPVQYSTTAVDAEFWAEWKAAHVGFAPLKNRAIFEARSEQEVGTKARESEKVPTGFEPMTHEDAAKIGVKPYKAE